MRLHGTENAAPSMMQPAMHRSSTNILHNPSHNTSSQPSNNTNNTNNASTPQIVGLTSPMANGVSNHAAESSSGTTGPPPGQPASAGPSGIPGEAENGNQPEEPLPAGWEMRYDVYGRR